MNIGPFHIDWETLTVTSSMQLKDFSTIPASIAAILKNPGSNPIAFLLIVAIIAVLLLVVIITIVAWFTRPKKPKLIVETVYRSPEETTDDGQAVEYVVKEQLEKPKDRMRKYYSAGTMLIILFLIWLTAGAITQVDRVCLTCHLASGTDAVAAHVKKTDGDPHQKTRCVQCHESYGTFASLTTGMPGRFAHIIVGTFQKTDVPGYQTTSDYACGRCHAGSTEQGQVYGNVVRMSHYEPFAAGMSCLQCHTLSSENQKITQQVTGMQECLKCHDGQIAPVGCKTCHLTGVYAGVNDQPSPENAQNLTSSVPADRHCYECHATKGCDNCHGLRMPHPSGYADSLHDDDVARLGIKTCWNCHKKADCLQCHGADQF
ncbi:MAG: hypothetical protein LBS17_02030 [Actinomycetes bacterium]|jgi:hypothetical protein|nr:hypothetical protein [Actinomycetes bacterium]